HHRPADRIQDVHDVGGQRLDGVIGAGRAVAVAVSAAVQRDDVEPRVGQDLAGVFPGVPVLAATVQHEDGRVAGRVGAAVPFVGHKGDPAVAGKFYRPGAAAPDAHAF